MPDKSPHIDPVVLRALLERVAGGEELAFAELLRGYGDTIFSQAMAYVRSVEQAEELTQDVFLRVWKNREKLVEVENFENWLFIVARNLVFEKFKVKLKEPLLQTIPSGFAEATELDTPDLLVEGKETHRLSLAGIALLPEKRQQVFRMSREEGLNSREIAERLGIDESTVRHYIIKSLSFLKSYLNHTAPTRSW